jgi:tricorn protease-like protein
MQKNIQSGLAILLVLLLMLGIHQTADSQPLREISLMSVSSSGVQVNMDAYMSAVSADGRFVAFVTMANNLVSGDTNNTSDVFVHDRETGQTERVSVASNGTQANYESEYPVISGNGRYVAFVSYATNLVSGDTNNAGDIFVHDRETNTTTRVSVDSSGNQANDTSYSPQISLDGAFVTFFTRASNLVSGDTNNRHDIFVHNLATQKTERISVGLSGTESNGSSNYPSISGDGRYVSFISSASNLVSNDSNDMDDVFVYDRQTGTTVRVSKATDGTQANDDSYQPSISPDGRFVAFQSYATNLVSGDTNGFRDIFVHDLQSGMTERLSIAYDGSEANGSSSSASISSQGRFVIFNSSATNLVGDDTNNHEDVFRVDRLAGTIVRVSIADDGTEGNSYSVPGDISPDGQFVVFNSPASNLVSDDNNGNSDVFLVKFTQLHFYLPLIIR